MAQPKGDASERIRDFMLLEFDVLHRRIDLLERKKAERTSVFTGATAVVAAASISSIDRISSSNLLLRVCAWVLALIGVATYRQNIWASVQVVLLYRRAGRIRAYFEDLSPSVRPYLPWASGDDTPPFRDSESYSTFEGPDFLILSLVAVAIGYGTWLGNNVWQLGLAATSSLVLTFGLSRMSGKMVDKAEIEGKKAYNIHFPYRTRVSSSDELDGHR